MRRPRRSGFAAVLLSVVAVVCGCAFGPRAIEKTHGKYNSAVQRTDEEQFLKTVVRLRYVEGQRSLDVTSIAAQYELTGTGEMQPFFSTEAPGGNLFGTFSRVLPFASVTGANRPTISMIPQDDGAVVRQFLTPISGETLGFLVQSGWPVENILRIWVDRINGVPNYMPASGPPREGAADFDRFVHAAHLLQRAQDEELVTLHQVDRFREIGDPLPGDHVTAAAMLEAAKAGYEYHRMPDGKAWRLVKKERVLSVTVSPKGKGSPEVFELADLLNLQHGLERYETKVESGVPDPGKNPSEPSKELRLGSRSTALALFFLANGVEVPAEHTRCGLVRVPPDGSNPIEATRGVFHVRCCPGHRHHRPPCAYVAIHYRDHWYYIDDSDQQSKSTLLLMLELRRLDFKRQDSGAPTLTLPVGH